MDRAIQPHSDHSFNILLLGNLYFPETRIWCICKNLPFVGRYTKIRSDSQNRYRRWAELLIDRSHVRTIQFWSHWDPDVQLNSCHPLSAVTSRSLLLSRDHVLCISYPDAHDWGQMFSTLNFILWDSLYFSWDVQSQTLVPQSS